MSEKLMQLSVQVLDPNDCLLKTNHKLTQFQICARESSGRGGGPYHVSGLKTILSTFDMDQPDHVTKFVYKFM